MTAVRFVFPKPRLAELLRMPGGLPVAEAIERAQKNLESIKPTCVAEMIGLLEMCEVALQSLGDNYDEQGLEQLYAMAVRGIGGGAVCGVPDVDPALTSFCDLLDQLRTSKRFDREAIGVHVRSWRLLMTMDLPEAGRKQVLDGLLKVTRHYASDEAPGA